MRQIIRVFEYDELQLVDGEWIDVPQREKAIIEECETLEEALEILAIHNSMDKDEYTSFHIGYEKSEDLPQWEIDWVNNCVAKDRYERKELARSRKRITPFDDEWYEIGDDLIEELAYEEEEEFNVDYYDWIEE